jgi:hypothetical protein
MSINVRTRLAARLIAIGLSTACFPVAAQPASQPAANTPSVQQIYKWRDAQGKLVVSDRPPSGQEAANAKRVEIPTGRTAAGGVRLAVAPSSDSARAEAAASDSAKGRNAPSRQELAQRAEAETRQKENCTQAQAELRTLESGIRIMTVNPQGEREFMEDDARARRTAIVRKNVSEFCKG